VTVFEKKVVIGPGLGKLQVSRSSRSLP